MKKKGVELTLQTIVIAAILLLVLVVIIMIFSKYMGAGTRDADRVNDGFSCPTDKSCTERFTCAADETQAFGNFKAHKIGMKCCCK